MPKYGYYRPNRNDACPCGSGRKFKKCCFERVEEETNSLRRAAGEVARSFPRLVEALGLALGTRGGRADLLGAEEIGHIIETLYRKITGESEETYEAYFRTLEKNFSGLLRRKKNLQFLRFPVAEVNELLSKEKDWEKGSFLAAASREFFTREFAEAAINVLLDTLRREALEKEEVEQVIGMLCLLLEVGDVSSVGAAVLRATLQDAHEYTEGMKKVLNTTDVEEKQKILEELAEKVPFVVEEVSHDLFQKVRPFLKQLADGEIPFPLPPYGYLQAILTVRKLLVLSKRNIKTHKEKEGLPEIEEMVGNLESILSLKTFEKDVPCFMEALSEVIASWLKDSKLNAEHKESLGALMTLVLLPNLYVTDLLFDALYLCVVTKLLERGILSMETLQGEKREIPLLELSPQDLDQYALYLENKGKVEPAARVREAGAALAEEM